MIIRKKAYPTVLSVDRIWDYALIDSTTDLIYFRGYWLCSLEEEEIFNSFRQSHIRIIGSADGIRWSSKSVLLTQKLNLSEPRLSLTPDHRLMLVVNGVPAERSEYSVRQSYVSFSLDGRNWSAFQPILKPHEWIGKVTWQQNQAFAVAYAPIDESQVNKGTFLKIVTSSDGLHYHFVTSLDLPKNASEGTIEFMNEREMIGLFAKKTQGINYLWLGKSTYPFYHWRGELLNYQLEKFNCVLGQNEQAWILGSLAVSSPYSLVKKMTLLHLEESGMETVLSLPSGGNISYPGVVCKDENLWISYASFHEEQGGIYLAHIRLSK